MNDSQTNPMPSATVIVCTRNRPHELEGCLQALANLRYPDYEVLVVENGEADGYTREIVQRHQVRYLHSPVPGLSRARNDGARHCNTELLAYTDDDARPHPDWLLNLAREFSDPAVMAAGGEMRPRTIGTSYDENTCADLPSRIIGPDSPDWFAESNFGGIGDGCNMCFRRAAFELWPGFDERLGRGAILDSAEEHFAFFQLVLLGYKCVHTPRAIVQHPSASSPEEVYAFHRNNLVNAVAYGAILWAEFPETRGLLLKHIWSRSFGERKKRRDTSDSPKLSLLEYARVIISGLRLFRRTTRSRRRPALLSAQQPTSVA